MSYPTPTDSPEGYIADPRCQSQQGNGLKHDPLAEVNTHFKKLQRSVLAWLAEQEKHITLLREANDDMPGDTTRQESCIEKIEEENKNLIGLLNQFEDAHIDLLNRTTTGDTGRPQAGSSSHIETLRVDSSYVPIQDHTTAIGDAHEHFQPLEGVNMDVVQGMTQNDEEHILAATNHLEGGQTGTPDQINGGNADHFKARLAWSDDVGVGSFIGPHIKIQGYGQPAVDTNGRLMRDVHFACPPGFHCQAPCHDGRNATYIPQEFTIAMDAIETAEKLLVFGLHIGVCVICNNDVGVYDYGPMDYCRCKTDRCPPCIALWAASLQRTFDELLMMGKKSCKYCGTWKNTKQYLLCYMCKLPVREAQS